MTAVSWSRPGPAGAGAVGVIERILPAEVVAVESFGDPAGLVLYAEEEALVARAVEKRRREFTTVRHCARQALRQLGHPPAPILPGQRGAPRWPAGVVGSMTHCDGYRAAALAEDTDVISVGVDAEPHLPLPAGVLDSIALPAERRRTAGLLADRLDVCWDRLLFSAKEAVYKAWFPLTGRWLDFADADVLVDPGAATFVARLLVPGPRLAGSVVDTFAGRFVVTGGVVATAVTLPSPGRRPRP